LLAVRLRLQRVAQLEKTVREAPQLLAALFVVQRVAERLVREPRRLVDELLRTADRHALLHLDAQLVEVDGRERRRHERLLAELDRLCEVDLLLRGEERDLADLLEVHADRVVDADEVRREDRRDGVLALHLLGLFLFLFDLGPVRSTLGLEDLDVVVVEGDEQLFDLRGLGVRDRADEVLLRDVALLTSLREQALRMLLVLRVDPGALGCCGLAVFFFFADCLQCFHSFSLRSMSSCNTVRRSTRVMAVVSSFASRSTSTASSDTSPSAARASSDRFSPRRSRSLCTRRSCAAISIA